MKNKINKNIKTNPVICICNNVPKDRIEKAIVRGCNSLPKIYDATTAGVGPCGGSCRPILKKMLDHYLKTKEFLADPRKNNHKK
ncbi:MAG: (2Fe-2S)-binding protein [Bdellovibrionaceae bacterium]|nr:(2Fe-2S)-binding protein [Pseudobdellovibrionaceae bacterium]